MNNGTNTTAKRFEVEDQNTMSMEDVKKYFCPEASEKELYMFLNICKSFQLNPFKREVYLVKYGKAPATILVGYETYLKRAERSGKYNGMKAWTTGEAKDFTLKGHVEVYRKDWEKPLSHEVDYDEYVAMNSEGKPTRFWAQKPKTMIKKVAISQAFRFAFPDEFAGMPYTADEINTLPEAQYQTITARDESVETNNKGQGIDKAGQRIKVIDGIRYPHVTDIICPDGKPIPNITEHAYFGTLLDGAFKNWMDNGNFIPKEEVVDQANIGNLWPEIYKAMSDRIEKWNFDKTFDFKGHSKSIVSKEHVYCGELDVYGYINVDGKKLKTVFDIKKTKSLKGKVLEEYKMQIAAYAKAFDNDIEAGCILSPFNEPVIISKEELDKSFNGFLELRKTYKERFGF